MNGVYVGCRVDLAPACKKREEVSVTESVKLGTHSCVVNPRLKDAQPSSSAVARSAYPPARL